MEHDILAFGQDLIAARPKLRQAAQGLGGSGDVGRLVICTIDDAWRRRGQYRQGQDLDAWLQGLLHRVAGERRSFAEDRDRA
jgi:DNA-directed RNA polymerase specialized sigma24 family protein